MINAVFVQQSLLEAKPGIGKTRIMGYIVQAITRLQLKGQFQGKVLIIIKRKAHVNQQAVGQKERREAIQHFDTKSIFEVGYFLRPLLGIKPFEAIPQSAWKTVFRERIPDLEDARRVVRDLFTRHNLLEMVERTPGAMHYLESLAKMLAGMGTLIMAPNGREKDPNRKHMEFLELSPPENTQEKESDFLFGVPEELWKSRSVYIQTDLELAEVPEQKLPDQNTKVAVLSATSLTQHGMRQKLAPFLKGVNIILVDELGLKAAHEIQAIVRDGGGRADAMVIAATAFCRGMLRRTFDHCCSYVDEQMGVNGPDHALNPQRWDMFPDVENSRYPSGSLEAFEQFMQEYRAHRALPADQGKVQPWEGPHLVVVDADLVAYATMRLREEFGDTGTHFISLDANTSPRFNARIQTRMNDPHLRNTCIVTSPQPVMDSYDWRLHASYIAVHDPSKGAEYTVRLSGRQLHGEPGFIIQQCFSDDKSRNNTIFNAMQGDVDAPKNGHLSVTPGEVFIGIRERIIEKSFRSGKSYPARKVPVGLSGSEHGELDLREGTFLPHKGKQPDFPIACTFPVIFDGESSADYARRFAEANGLGTYIDQCVLAVRGCNTPDSLHEALTKVTQQCARAILQCGVGVQGNGVRVVPVIAMHDDQNKMEDRRVDDLENPLSKPRRKKRSPMKSQNPITNFVSGVSEEDLTVIFPGNLSKVADACITRVNDAVGKSHPTAQQLVTDDKELQASLLAMARKNGNLVQALQYIAVADHIVTEAASRVSALDSILGEHRSFLRIEAWTSLEQSCGNRSYALREISRTMRTLFGSGGKVLAMEHHREINDEDDDV